MTWHGEQADVGGIVVYVQRHYFGDLWYFWIERKPPVYSQFYRADLRDSRPYGFASTEAEAQAAAIEAAKATLLGKPYRGLSDPVDYSFLPETSNLSSPTASRVAVAWLPVAPLDSPTKGDGHLGRRVSQPVRGGHDQHTSPAVGTR